MKDKVTIPEPLLSQINQDLDESLLQHLDDQELYLAKIELKKAHAKRNKTLNDEITYRLNHAVIEELIPKDQVLVMTDTNNSSRVTYYNRLDNDDIEILRIYRGEQYISAERDILYGPNHPKDLYQSLIINNPTVYYHSYITKEEYNRIKASPFL